jgi:hypothetical protein
VLLVNSHLVSFHDAEPELRKAKDVLLSVIAAIVAP